MISLVFGIAIVALPAGIVTAGYMEELNHRKLNSSRRLQDDDKEAIVNEGDTENEDC